MSGSSRRKTTKVGTAVRWDLTAVYPDDDAFHRAKVAFEKRLPSLSRWRGRLGESAATLAEALDGIAEASKRLRRLHAYASMTADEDMRIAARHALREGIELLFPLLASRTAYFGPEILGLPRGRVAAFLREEPGLLPHAHALRTILRQRRHFLGPREEELLAQAGLLAGGPGAIFGLLHNAELPRAGLRLSSGERVQLTPAAYAFHRASPVRGDRRRVVRRYFDAYHAFEATLGQNLFECVKQHVFRARARRYESCVDAALDGDAVPTTVYRTLLAQARGMLPLLHRYFRLRARALGLRQLAYHDLYCPLTSSPTAVHTVGGARRAVRRALAPLGSAYAGELDRAFRGRWIDWHPAPGKRAGAYANGAAYDVHPFVLLNFSGDFESVSTLAHEVGHAMHSHFSNRAQPYPAADYSTFVAEVASTFHEILLHDDLLRRARGSEERLFLTARWLDDLRATFFRQAMFAEFELAIHERVERGEALTGRSLSRDYLEALRRFSGHDQGVVRVEERCGIEWAAIPHFHYGFYVYQYATGIAASMSLAERVLGGRPQSRQRYLAFLRAGGSDDPLALLRRAGVDLETAEPYEAVARALTAYLDRLEEMLDDAPRRRSGASA
ncbi:MAG: oligoendopeptidase F family protein [Acidobacteriia bacterium]|nr:oligoendopeptidase F family protein [Terriglobia bacterium]